MLKQLFKTFGYLDGLALSVIIDIGMINTMLSTQDWFTIMPILGVLIVAFLLGGSIPLVYICIEGIIKTWKKDGNRKIEDIIKKLKNDKKEE